MLKTRTLVAIGLLVVVGGAVAWQRSKKDPHAAQPANKAGEPVAGAPKIVTAELDEIAIAETGKPDVVLKKVGDAWRVVAPVDDAADSKNVESSLKTLGELSWKGVIAESADSHEKLGVKDADVVKVSLKKGGQPVTSLWIGKTGKVRVDGGPQVWDVGKMNRFAFARDPKLWRKREVFRIEKKDVERIELEVMNGAAVQKLVAHRDAAPTPPPPAEGQPPAPPVPDKWTLTAGAELVGGPLDESVPLAVMSALTRLDVADFADGKTAADAGLTAPRARVAAVLADGTRKAIEIGAEDGEDVYVRVEGDARVFKLRKPTIDTLWRAPLQWRDKVLAKIDGKDVTRVEVMNGSEKSVFERVDASTWKPVTPAEIAEFDTQKVQGLASSFANVRAQSIAELAPADAKKAFAKPLATVTLAKKEGVAATFTVGEKHDKSYYVKVSGRPEIFLLAEGTITRWMKSPADFKKSPPPPTNPHMNAD